MKSKTIRKNLRNLIIFGLVTQLFSCAHMLENRTFIDQMDNQREDIFVPGEDFSYVPGDAGAPFRSKEEIAMRTPASEYERKSRAEDSSLYRELSFRERRLTMREREIYNHIQDQLETPSEKIYYLSLSPNERREYLDSRMMEYPQRGYGRSGARGLASLQPIYRNSLELGMTKDDVVNRWGRPARVEVAGNPTHENERWAFYENGSIKYVYFEGGAVQGWNMQ